MMIYWAQSHANQAESAHVDAKEVCSESELPRQGRGSTNVRVIYVLAA